LTSLSQKESIKGSKKYSLNTFFILQILLNTRCCEAAGAFICGLGLGLGLELRDA